MAVSGFGHKTIKFLLAAGIFVLWLFVVWRMAGICFELNDDRCIGEILSGTMTGEPESRTVYMNYLPGVLLSLLYRIAAQIPWYGGMLVLCHLAVYTVLTLGVWSRAKTLGEYVVFTGLAGCFALAGVYMTAAVQYTSTAALMAAAGYGCLILWKEPKKGRRLFFFFQLAAFLLRGQAMMMMQPLGAALCGGMYLAAKGETPGEKCRKLAKMLWALLLAGAVGLGGMLLAFQGQGWRDYYRFNRAEEEMFDYYGQPDYEEVKPILDKYGVTRAEYTAYCNYVILDWDISTECAEELAEYAENRRQESVDAGTLLGRMWEELKSNGYLRMNWASAAAWAAVLLWMFFRRRPELAAPAAGLALGRTAAWGYLVYVDRLPYRVTLPLFAGEFILLVCLLVKDYGDSREACCRKEACGEENCDKEACRKENCGKEAGRGGFGKVFGEGKALVLLLCALFAFSCVFTGKAQYGEALEANSRQKIFIESLVEIGGYCDRHTDNRYLLDTQSVIECNGSVFETRIYGEHNYVYSGTWYSNSPGVREHLREYLEAGNREFFLIVRDDGTGASHYGVVYLAEKLGREPAVEDRITVSGGGSYLVWAFR